METRISALKRNQMIDILKAVGIISIVIGHSCDVLPMFHIKIGRFVYTYHIMIFMFIAGFCFNKKCADDPFGYIGRRLKSTFPMYFFYNVVFILLHNSLVKWRLIPLEQGQYSFDVIFARVVSVITLSASELLGGALWFVPMYLFAVVLFCFLFSYAGQKKHPVFWHGAFFFLSAVLGIYSNWKGLMFGYHIQTSILAIPVIYLGYLAKCHWSKIEKHVTGIGTVACAAIIYIILLNGPGFIELSINYILSPVLFYPVTVMGIYFCIGISKLIEKRRGVARLFANIGRESYHIMALHFLAFKFLDVIYGYFTHADTAVLSKFPHSFSFYVLYWIVGIFVPLGIINAYRKMIDFWRSRL